MKYKEWLTLWMVHYVSPRVKDSTMIRYKERIRVHIEKAIGDYELDSLTPFLLQSFITELKTDGNRKTGKGLSSSFINSIISLVKSSLRRAYSNGLRKQFPAGLLVRPKPKEKPIDCFTFQEQKKLETYIRQSPKKKLYGIILCLYTGIRIGELLALTWQDIDLKKGLIRITKTCHDISRNGFHTREITDPKTESSKRVVPIPNPIIGLLKEREKESESQFVINDNHKPVFIRSYQRTFELLLRKLKLKHRGFHSLRHTFATRAIECGRDIKTLSEILGHKNAAITLNRYSHSLLDHKKARMTRLGRLF